MLNKCFVKAGALYLNHEAIARPINVDRERIEQYITWITLEALA